MGKINKPNDDQNRYDKNQKRELSDQELDRLSIMLEREIAKTTRYQMFFPEIFERLQYELEKNTITEQEKEQALSHPLIGTTLLSLLNDEHFISLDPKDRLEVLKNEVLNALIKIGSGIEDPDPRYFDVTPDVNLEWLASLLIEKRVDPEIIYCALEMYEAYKELKSELS